MITCCWLTYLVGDVTHTSGIITSLFAGMVMGAYAPFNMTVQGHMDCEPKSTCQPSCFFLIFLVLTAITLLSTISFVCDLIIFIFVGAYFTTIWNMRGIVYGLWATLFCLLGRGVSVFLLSFIIKLVRKYLVNWEVNKIIGGDKVNRFALPKSVSLSAEGNVALYHNKRFKARMANLKLERMYMSSDFFDNLDVRLWTMDDPKKWNKCKA